jgi:hypothetical protein
MRMKCNFASRHDIKEKGIRRRRDGKYFIRSARECSSSSRNYKTRKITFARTSNAELRSFCERKCNKKLIEIFYVFCKSLLLSFISHSITELTHVMGDDSAVVSFPLSIHPFVSTRSLAFFKNTHL